MGFLIGLIAAAAVLAVGAVALGRKGSNAEIRKRLSDGGMSPEQAVTLREADQTLRNSRRMVYDIRNEEVRLEAKGAIEKADQLLEALKVQPSEIRRANQFFIYYVPTLPVILRKFVTLEKSGTLAPEDELIGKTKDHLTEMAKAFDLMNENLYKDEALDLTVEVEAMQMALKREGLS